MPPRNPLLRAVHSVVVKVPPLINAYRAVRDYSKHDFLATSIYKKVFDRGRLKLQWIEAESLSPEAGAVTLPAIYPIFAGEDAPLIDVLFLLNLAKARKVMRILEVGTYRARTTLALHLNRPEARIVSYDIQVLPSRFRDQLIGVDRVELRHASFSDSAEILKKEEPYDFIFVDGSHILEHVLEDSTLAFQILAKGGVIVWHDYRQNEYYTAGLRVPEALAILQHQYPIFGVRGTTCAVHTLAPSNLGTSLNAKRPGP